MEQHQVEQPIHFVIERDDGYIDILNAQSFFHSYPMWPSLEIEFLTKVKSPILDIGSGAGRHGIYLQALGYEVAAMDISPGAVEVSKKRGVKDVILGSALDFPKFEQIFETILLFGHNLSIAGSKDGLTKLLMDMRKITSDTGVIIANYASPTPTDNPFHLTYHENNIRKGLPIGLVQFCIRYKLQRSENVNWYLPTQAEFNEIINKTDWKIQSQKEEAGTNTQYVILEKR
ncbi:MAG: class I SAM-dependent methyltransferase [Candidatus Kariarchaeaceae archaeon]